MAAKKQTHETTALATTAGEAAPETTALTVALPGAAKVDNMLLDEAVEEINHLTMAHGLEHARAVGEVIVRRFGGGDLDAFRTGATQHTSWRALADRDDLGVSHSFLWGCVAVLHQLRILPDAVGKALPVSHHRRLLAIRDDDTRLALATKAVDEKLSVQDLEAEVAKVRKDEATGEKRGRKPLPAFAKSVRALPRLLKDVESKDVTAIAIQALGTDEAETLVATIDTHIGAITALREAIRGRLDSAKAE